MPELPERTALYRLYDASDRLLYIGIAKDTKKRWKDHELIQRWWHLVARHTITWLPSREQALAVEEKTVREETPLYNAERLPNGRYKRLKYDDTREVRHAADSLLREIADGVLTPGTQIHLVRLARRYGVSAISVMGALRSLPHNAIEERGNTRWVAKR
ncbi:GntR family transcriptional regulator [Streptomyces sp. NBC_01716]|uniref:GntR family transcriptional regulator n=1 Tax=Streptomyces sp. NBC_01716 TaxID=2975917 RepID=UPI002E31509E|nr:GntR family transcriptional regulator [Streptomyces sp. NBC_01716]